MKRPNILFITWHDAGRWFGCYGNSNVRTPNVDALSADGVRFTNLFSASAICSPSRAAMMTGRTCQNVGVMGLTNTPFNHRIRPDVPHLSAIAKSAGYHTALFGVEHECAHEHIHEILRADEQYATDPWSQASVTADHLCSWLRGRKGRSQPFYAQWGLYESHLGSFFSGQTLENYPPVQDDSLGICIPPYLSDTPYGREAVRTLQGLLRRGDEAIGRVLTSLKESGLDNETLVVMCVDHGVGLPRAKTTCYNSGTAVALIMRHPGSLPAGRVVNALCGQVDVFPTVLSLAGLPVPAGIYGRSMAEHALGKRDDDIRDAVFSHMVETTRSIRTGTHKFIRNFRPSEWPVVPAPAESCRRHPAAKNGGVSPSKPDVMPHVELYDLRNDPDELRNLAGDSGCTAIHDELDSRLWEFLFEQDDFVLNEPIRIPWQLITRRDMEAYCKKNNRTSPLRVGPLA